MTIYSSYYFFPLFEQKLGYMDDLVTSSEHLIFKIQIACNTNSECKKISKCNVWASSGTHRFAFWVFAVVPAVLVNRDTWAERDSGRGRL